MFTFANIWLNVFGQEFKENDYDAERMSWYVTMTKADELVWLEKALREMKDRCGITHENCTVDMRELNAVLFLFFFLCLLFFVVGWGGFVFKSENIFFTGVKKSVSRYQKPISTWWLRKQVFYGSFFFQMFVLLFLL